MPAVLHVNLPVAHGQAEAVARFYVEVLGFSVAPRPESPRVGRWLDVDGATQVHLTERDGTAHPDQHVAFRVEDFDGVHERAVAAGAPWSDRAEGRATLRDPAGNLIEVFAPGVEPA